MVSPCPFARCGVEGVFFEVLFDLYFFSSNVLFVVL